MGRGLFFSSWQWLWLASAVGLVSLALLIWSYRTAPSGIVRWLCPVLKALGIALLAICLLEPMWSGQRAKPGANLFAIVADNSEGLQIKDPGASKTRGAKLAELLSRQHGWQETLEENFELRRYIFDSRLQATRDFSELSFDGRSSAIGGALRSILERYQGRRPAGILLLTDGNATDLGAIPDLTGAPPIYPVVIGQSGDVQDIAIQQVGASRTDFEDAPVNLQCQVNAVGYQGSLVSAQVVDAAGKVVAQQEARAREARQSLGFNFRIKPEKAGTAFYRVQAAQKGQSQAGGATTEATLANNTGFVAVDRGHGPYRILYVSGRPNWEFKFLNRALQEDDQLQLTALIRVAKREPKFNFIGRAGESSNPLFRGFGNQAPEEVERYDQPVLVRLNARDAEELRTGFPRTPEDLYGFHAVVLDDIEAEFFTADQSLLLQKFVSERGGGFLMLGGMESFGQGKYARTAIGDMLPVYLDRAVQNTNPAAFYRFNLTREGWLQTWARLRDNEADERARLEGMSPFSVLNTVKDIKPGASIIATVSDPDGNQLPALVVQRFGHGRSAALTVGDVWRWGLQNQEAHTDMDKSWRQMFRWLVTDVPNRVEISAEPNPDEGNGAMRLVVRARDAKFQAVDNAAVTLEVQTLLAPPGVSSTNTVRLTAEPSTREAGAYECVFVPRTAGCFRARVAVKDENNAELGRAETGWSTDLASEEFHSLQPNVALLEELARKTGGEVIPSGKLDQFAKSLPFRQAAVMEPFTAPFWHTPALFAFALACFLGEWGVRRWKGLP